MLRGFLLSTAVVLLAGSGLAGCGGGSGGGGGGTPTPVVIGPQTGKIAIDLATLDVTVVQQPTHLLLTPDALASWAGLGNPLTFGLRIRNNYPRLLFNLKAIVTAITGDPMAGATGDGMFDGKPFFYYGPTSIPTAASRDDTVTVDNISMAAGTVEIEFEFLNHRMLFGSEGYYDGSLFAVDSSGSGMSYKIDLTGFGNTGHGTGTSNNYSNTPCSGVCSPDGRFLYMGWRNQPALLIVDTTSMTPVLGQDLSSVVNNIRHDSSGMGSQGFTRGVRMSPDAQYLYTVLHTNAELYECSTSTYDTLDMKIEVVKLDRQTLLEVGRVTLLDDVDECQGRPVSISADGTRGVVAIKVYDGGSGNPAATVQGKIFTLDLVNMSATVLDVSGIGPVIDRATVSPDGSQIYISSPSPGDGSLRRMPFGGGPITTLPGAIAGFTQQYVKALDFGPDGRLYLASYNGFAIYDIGAGAFVEPVRSTTYAYGQQFSPGENACYVMRDDGLVECYDLATDMLIPSPADGNPERVANGLEEGHSFLVTPF